MFSEILEKLLAERGISALTLSKEIGIPKSILYEWKSGKREPSTANLRRLADYFGVTPGYLLGREEEDGEEELLVLLRQAKQLSPTDHDELVQSFKHSLSLYLRTKQGK